ncbi:flagellar motor protein MotB, partial [Flavobacterium sp. MC2016-06]
MILRKLKTAFVLLMVCLVSIGSLQAQDKQLEKANEAYKRFAFVEAGKLYKKSIENGNATVEAYSKLGNCYYFNADYTQAAAAYAELMKSKAAVNEEYYFRYAQSLNSTQQYNKAAEVMKEYYKKAGKKDLSENWTEAKLKADIQKQSGRYSLRTIDLNTPFSDFGTGFYGKDKVIYASAKDTGVIIKRKHSWNEKSFLKLYTADINVDGGLSNAV